MAPNVLRWTSMPWPWRLGTGLDGVLAALSTVEDPAVQLLVHHHWKGLLAAVERQTPWWSTGTAGFAVAAAQVQHALGEPVLQGIIDTYLDAVTTTLQSTKQEFRGRPGLQYGWAGVSLALLRVAQLMSNRDHCVELAARALQRELDQLVHTQGHVYSADEGRLMPHLGIGSAAAALAVHALTRVGAAELVPQHSLLRDEAIATLFQRSIADGSLLMGRSGIMHTLRTLDPNNPMVEVHQRRLAWHTRTVTVATQTPPRTSHRALIGAPGIACSLDLATGSAGAIAALTPGAVERVLLLPVDEMTGVTHHQ